MTADDRITLDQRAFSALASDTRVRILKSLDGSQKTVTDLARELEMNKATMFQHLEKLQEAGLVKRKDGKERLTTVKPVPNEPEEEGPPRKWVYYGLSWKGQKVLHPERVRISLVLGTLGVIGLAILALVILSSFSFGPAGPSDSSADHIPPEVIFLQTPQAQENSTALSATILVHEGGITGLGGSSHKSGLDLGTLEVAVGNVIDPSDSDPVVRDYRVLRDGLEGVRLNVSSPSSNGSVEVTLWIPVELLSTSGRYFYLNVSVEDHAGNRGVGTTLDYIEPARGADLSLRGHDLPTIDALLSGQGLNTTVEVLLLNGTSTLSILVLNVGDLPSSSTQATLGLYLVDPDPDGDGDAAGAGMPISTSLIGGIAPGASTRIDIPLFGIQRDSQSGAGSESLAGRLPKVASTLYVVLDPSNALKDADRSNNVASVPIPSVEQSGFGAPWDEGREIKSPDGAGDPVSTPGFDGPLALTALVAAGILLICRRERR